MNRKEILEKGVALTCGDRDRTYGDPVAQHEAQGDFLRLLHRYAHEDLGSAELAALSMVLCKLVRCAVSPVHHPDNYVDGATYFAIAGECASREREPELFQEQAMEEILKDNPASPQACPHCLQVQGHHERCPEHDTEVSLDCWKLVKGSDGTATYVCKSCGVIPGEYHYSDCPYQEYNKRFQPFFR